MWFLLSVVLSISRMAAVSHVIYGGNGLVKQRKIGQPGNALTFVGVVRYMMRLWIFSFCRIGHPRVPRVTMAREWFAIRTKPNKEQQARLEYERQGYVVYLPLIRKTVRHARRKEEVLRPFFPGYLFLHLAPSERHWVSIASTRNTIGPVRFGDQYVPLPDWVIDDLRAREEGGAISLAALQKERLAPGAAVEVRIDETTTAPGLVYSLRGEENVVVLLELMGRQVRATVPLEQVDRRG